MKNRELTQKIVGSRASAHEMQLVNYRPGNTKQINILSKTLEIHRTKHGI